MFGYGIVSADHITPYPNLNIFLRTAIETTKENLNADTSG
jgi:hypothetical protein